MLAMKSAITPKDAPEFIRGWIGWGFEYDDDEEEIMGAAITIVYKTEKKVKEVKENENE